jgi:hypothetical protein
LPDVCYFPRAANLLKEEYVARLIRLRGPAMSNPNVSVWNIAFAMRRFINIGLLIAAAVAVDWALSTAIRASVGLSALMAIAALVGLAS